MSFLGQPLRLATCVCSCFSLEVGKEIGKNGDGGKRDNDLQRKKC